MDELNSQQVKLDDPFWSPRLEVNAQRAIFHQWEQLEASGCIDNFRIAAGEKEFTLYLRLPSWSGNQTAITLWEGNHSYPIEVKPQDASNVKTAQGYDPRLSRFLPIQRVWSEGDVIEIYFELPIILRRAHLRVKKYKSKVALTRGPLVYCLESVDNPNIDLFSARLDPKSIHLEQAADLLGGITLLRGRSTNGTMLTFIPYSLWANRGESKMTVWINV